MFFIDYTLKPPMFMHWDIFEEILEGIKMFLLFLLWLVTAILNIATLGIFGFLWSLVFFIFEKNKHKTERYEIRLFGNCIYSSE